MRSRYAAYVAHRVRYVMTTTHPDSIHYQEDASSWRRELLAFCKSTEFLGLQIVDARCEGDRAEVTFVATLRQAKATVPMRERSAFAKVDGEWLYLEALDDFLKDVCINDYAGNKFTDRFLSKMTHFTHLKPMSKIGTIN